MNAAQLLRSRTAFIGSVPVSPVHLRILSIQIIMDLPRPRFPSTRTVVRLPKAYLSVQNLCNCKFKMCSVCAVIAL